MNSINYILAILVLITIFIPSCDYGYIDHEFEGYFYETKWIYSFRIDGTYKLSSYGHLGVEGEFDSGRYSIVEYTIQLYPEVDRLEQRKYKKFFKISNSKIIDMNGNIFYAHYQNYEDHDHENDVCFRKQLKNLIQSGDGYKYLKSQLNSDYDLGFDTIYYGMHSVERHFDQIYKVYGYKYFDHRIKTEIIANRTKRYISLRNDSVYIMTEAGLEIDKNFDNRCK